MVAMDVMFWSYFVEGKVCIRGSKENIENTAGVKVKHRENIQKTTQISNIREPPGRDSSFQHSFVDLISYVMFHCELSSVSQFPHGLTEATIISGFEAFSWTPILCASAGAVSLHLT